MKKKLVTIVCAGMLALSACSLAGNSTDADSQNQIADEEDTGKTDADNDSDSQDNEDGGEDSVSGNVTESDDATVEYITVADFYSDRVVSNYTATYNELGSVSACFDEAGKLVSFGDNYYCYFVFTDEYGNAFFFESYSLDSLVLNVEEGHITEIYSQYDSEPTLLYTCAYDGDRLISRESDQVLYKYGYGSDKIVVTKYYGDYAVDTYEFDAALRPIMYTHTEGGTMTTRYEFDSENILTSMIRGDEFYDEEYKFDAEGNVIDHISIEYEM